MADQSTFLYQEREKRKGNPKLLREFELWDQALVYLATAHNSAWDMAEWLREPDKFTEPDLVQMLAAWARSFESIKELDGKQPVELDEEHGKNIELFTVEEIDKQLLGLDGHMEASEDHNPDLYQSTLNRQLTERLEKWIVAVTQPYESMDPDDDDVGKLCEERDMLEFARAGLNVIRMQNNLDTGKPRLPDVEHDRFRTKLREMDVVFRKIIEKEKREGRTYEDDLTPSTFWWRH